METRARRGTRDTAVVRVRSRRERPKGHRWMTSAEPVVETAQAAKFRYYDWLLWIPKRALVRVGDAYCAPAWAIDSAKDHESAERVP